tara:strand:+ start:1144 stop:1314 length:171 start_codon:yes stop_codon:yes gene_type:complete
MNIASIEPIKIVLDFIFVSEVMHSLESVCCSQFNIVAGPNEDGNIIAPTGSPANVE